MANNTKKVSNTFLTHSFITVAFLILIFGSISAINLIKVIGDIVSSGSTSSAPILIVTGIICLILMPYCFRVVTMLRIIEISDTDSKKRNLTLHPTVFVNDMNHPDEIGRSQIISISQDRIFKNLVELTFVENDEKQKVSSFIKKRKLGVIQKLLKQPPA